MDGEERRRHTTWEPVRQAHGTRRSDSAKQPDRRIDMPTDDGARENHPPEEGEAALTSLLASARAVQPFGPAFFLTHLRALVQDHCPAPGELPNLDLHLFGGEVLHVCHIVGVAPAWVALAVREAAHATAMQRVMIPYAAIARVTLRGVSSPPRPSTIRSCPS
jgi:hypothetical protein